MIKSDNQNVRIPIREKAVKLNIGQFYDYDSGPISSHLTYAGMPNEKVFSINIGLKSSSSQSGSNSNTQLYFPSSSSKFQLTVFDSHEKHHLFEIHSVKPEHIVLEELIKEE